MTYAPKLIAIKMSLTITNTLEFVVNSNNTTTKNGFTVARTIVYNEVVCKTYSLLSLCAYFVDEWYPMTFR